MVLETIRQIFDHSPVSVMLVDMKKEGLPIVYVNAAFFQLTGYNIQETLGRSCGFLQHSPDENLHENQKLRHAISHHESVQVELRNYTKEGRFFYNELSISPIFDEQGELIYYLGIQRDMTLGGLVEEVIIRLNSEVEQKVAEVVEKQEADEEIFLDSARRSISGDMISVLSSAVRSPLGYLLVNIQNLVDACIEGELDKDELVHISRKVHDVVENLSRSILKWQDFFSPSQTPRFFEPMSVLVDMNRYVAPLFERKGISMTLRFENDCHTQRFRLYGHSSSFVQLIDALILELNDQCRGNLHEFPIEIVSDEIGTWLYIDLFPLKSEKNFIEAPHDSVRFKLAESIVQKEFAGSISIEGASRFRIAIPHTTQESVIS